MREPTTTGSASRNELRARDLERLLEEQITGGTYPPGTRMPTVRELGHAYHVNKNTAARAYQALERRGLIDVARGRGVYVRDTVSADGAGAAGGVSWLHGIDALIGEAQAAGVNRSELLELLAAKVEAWYGPAGARVVFIECNTADLQTLSAELSTVTGIPFDQSLLDDALADPAALGRRYDLIVTTFQHLGALRQAMPAAARHKVVGVNAAPNHESLLDLARTHVGSYALICDTPSTIESLGYLVASYNPGALVVSALIDDQAQLRRAMSRAEAVVVTQSCRRRLPTPAPDQTVIIVYFTIDQQSIDFLRRRLSELSELSQPETLPGAVLRREA